MGGRNEEKQGQADRGRWHQHSSGCCSQIVNKIDFQSKIYLKDTAVSVIFPEILEIYPRKSFFSLFAQVILHFYSIGRM